MNIGIFSECYKPTMNGVVVSIETFRKELIKRGHKVFIFAPKAKIKNYHDENPYVFRVPSIITPFKKDYPLGLPYFTEIPKILPLMHLDIIHLQHPQIMGRFGRKLAKKFKIPTVYTYHTLLVEYAHYFPIFKNLVKKYLIKVSKDFSNSVDQVITPSKTIKELLINYGVKTPIEVLPTGITLKDYQNPYPEKIKKEYCINPKNKVLIYVGRLAEEKNILFLLDAFQAIQKKYPKCHLLLVGGGENEKKYQEKSKRLNLKNITFTGQLPKEKTNQTFAVGDIFLMPSLTDTQGIVVVEAMAAGLPAVVMDKFGPSEIVEQGKSGFKIAPNNLDEFVEKTILLLENDSLRFEMSKNARLRAKDFDSGKQTEKLIKLYERVIAKN